MLLYAVAVFKILSFPLSSQTLHIFFFVVRETDVVRVNTFCFVTTLLMVEEYSG